MDAALAAAQFAAATALNRAKACEEAFEPMLAELGVPQSRCHGHRRRCRDWCVSLIHQEPASSPATEVFWRSSKHHQRLMCCRKHAKQPRRCESG